jgi:hypothetical protein
MKIDALRFTHYGGRQHTVPLSVDTAIMHSVYACKNVANKQVNVQRWPLEAFAWCAGLFCTNIVRIRFALSHLGHAVTDFKGLPRTLPRPPSSRT